ncbi:thiamine/thiamine pyrophosphate ABC transporter permease ThiP, partial [Psychromonas aquatilis]
LAIHISHELSRRHYWAKALLLKHCSTTLVLPVLVAIIGMISIYGNSGILASSFACFDSELTFTIYGLNGILLAHV